MVIFHVAYTVRNGRREEFYQKICEKGIDVLSRQEEGCRKYDYSFPAGKKDELFLVEIWNTADDQQKHGRTPHFAALQELKKEYVTDVKIDKFHAESM